MPQKLTDEEYRNRIKNKFPNIKLVDKYVNFNTKLHCTCTIDGHEWDASPICIEKYGCPVCSGKIITTKSYIQRLKSIRGDDISLVDEYKGMDEKITHHCNIHNRDFEITPMAVLRGQGCPDCKIDKLRNAGLRPKHEALSKLYSIYGNEFELADDYHGESERHKFVHHSKEKGDHYFYSTFSFLYRDTKCPVCTNRQIVEGVNDIATTNPYVASLFKNKEETHMYVELSNKQVDFICPSCGRTVRKAIAFVSKNNDLCCPYCSDGISYPNKFAYNCLMQINNQLDFIEREYNPDWCRFNLKEKMKTGRYDIYFSVHNKKYILELDGGFHIKPHGKSGLSKEDVLYIDTQKTKLAQEHGITVIRIDCCYPRFDQRYDYIKNNFIKSELNQILDLSKINFDKANIDSLQSLVSMACNLWNDGFGTTEISQKLNINQGTVREYLKSGVKFNMCDYSIEINNIRCQRSKPVICLNTKEKFNSIVDAAHHFKLSPQVIQGSCSDKPISGGKIGDKKLVWMYISEYKNATDDEIRNKLLNAYNKKVVCVTKNVLFLSAKEASVWLGVDPSAIRKCCTGDSKTCGIDNDTQEHMQWMYYEDYIEKFDKGTLLLYGSLSA